MNLMIGFRSGDRETGEERTRKRERQSAHVDGKGHSARQSDRDSGRERRGRESEREGKGGRERGRERERPSERRTKKQGGRKTAGGRGPEQHSGN